MSKIQIVKKGKIERAAGVITIALLVFVALSAVYWHSNHGLELAPPQHQTHIITVSAYMWEFYPKEIKVNVGDHVILKVTSLDATHGIFLGHDHWKTTKTLELEHTQELEFVADKPGELQFFCTVYCGQGHAQMVGRVMIHPIKV